MWGAHFLPSLSLSSLSPLLFLPSRAFPQPPLLSFSTGSAGWRWGGEGLGPFLPFVDPFSVASFMVVGFLPISNKPARSPLLFFHVFLILTMEVGIEAAGEHLKGRSEARHQAFVGASLISLPTSPLLLNLAIMVVVVILVKKLMCWPQASRVAVVVNKKWGRDGGSDRAGAQTRWLFWGGLGASCGGRTPACFTLPSHLRAEGRPYLYLLAMEPYGRQRFFITESATWSLGGLPVPSGVVPGDGEALSMVEKLWTRLNFPSCFWGLFCKGQGPVCYFHLALGPVVIGCMLALLN
jgi:hypothetical protein